MNTPEEQKQYTKRLKEEIAREIESAQFLEHGVFICNKCGTEWTVTQEEVDDLLAESDSWDEDEVIACPWCKKIDHSGRQDGMDWWYNHIIEANAIQIIFRILIGSDNGIMVYTDANGCVEKLTYFIYERGCQEQEVSLWSDNAKALRPIVDFFLNGRTLHDRGIEEGCLWWPKD
jgi:uncharacterized protein YbaR (Trm112 family)